MHLSLIDESRAEKLIQLARSRFSPDLTAAELKVLRDSAGSAEPPTAGEGVPRPEVRPEFLQWLATDPEVVPQVDSKGLRIWGITVPGELNLEKSQVPSVLDFCQCDFKGTIRLLLARTQRISISESSLAELNGDRMTVDGSLLMYRVDVAGKISLCGAELKRQLRLSDVHLNATGVALDVDGASIGGDLFMWEGFTSQGTIRMVGTEIRGNLNCTGATLTSTKDALCAAGARIDGEVYLNSGFSSQGTVSAVGAEIRSNLNCSRAKLSSTGVALTANAARIRGDVYFNDGFECPGRIYLLDAKVDGNLDCSGAVLAKVGDVDPSTAANDVVFADRARIGGNVFLNLGFRTEGGLRLRGVEIGGNVYCENAKIAALNCASATVKGDFVWLQIQNSKNAILDLTGASVRSLHDEESSWPSPGKLGIKGLECQDLKLHEPTEEKNRPAAQQLETYVFPKERPLTCQDRIDWIMRQFEPMRLDPQPWMQLKGLLEKGGDEVGAKHVLYAFQCLRASRSVRIVRWGKIAFAWLQEAPQRILWSILVTLLVGWMIFVPAGSVGALAPTDAGAFQAFKKGTAMPDAYPKLNPYVYTLESTVPLAKLGQDDKWAPDPGFPSTSWRTNYWFLMWAHWILAVLGWFQAGVFGASIVNRFRT
jgi:hypothetical protein